MYTKDLIPELRHKLTEALSPCELRIEDFSAEHAGHEGAKHGGHYRVHIVAERFSGHSRVARHRMVYEALADNLKRNVHALVIVAEAPDETTRNDNTEPDTNDKTDKNGETD